MGLGDPNYLPFLPLVSVVILVITNLLHLHLNRLAHRLRYFQMYFIEDRLPDICWGRVGFAYRDYYESTFLAPFQERIANNRFWLIIVLQLLSFTMVAYLVKEHSTAWKIVVVAAALLTFLQWLILKYMTNCNSIKEAFKETMNKRVDRE